MYQTIFFDMDGTLCDSKSGITSSIIHALATYGIHAEPAELEQYIGPPLKYTFSRFGFEGDALAAVIARYRERYTSKGLYELSLYDGVPDMLGALRDAGKRLILATAKVEETAVKIARNTGIAQYFTDFAGADLAAGREEKADILHHALAKAGIAETKGCVMVGDRDHDVRGAHATGMPCVAVLYGYGGRAELEAAGADVFVESVSALCGTLLGDGSTTAG